MEPTRRQYKLEDLACEAGVSIRTVRYYVQRGLLSAPAFRARGTSYDEDHLLRLKAIRQLQARFLPLETIAGLLSGCDRDGLLRLAEGADPGPLAFTSEPGQDAPAEGGPASARPPVHQGLPGRRGILGRPEVSERNQTPVTETLSGSLSEQEKGEGTIWRRWELAPGLELHLSDTADATVRELAERLRSLAPNGETT